MYSYPSLAEYLTLHLAVWVFLQGWIHMCFFNTKSPKSKQVVKLNG